MNPIPHALAAAMLAVCAAAAIAADPAPGSAAGTPDEAAAQSLYRERCASCHDGGEARAPQRAALKLLTPARVRAALASPAMAAHAQGLTESQLEALSRLLGATAAAGAADAKRCPTPPPPLDAAGEQPHWLGWGVDGAQRRFQRAEMARLSAADVPRLRLRWAFGFEGATRAYAQPAVLGGMLFVGSAGGVVHALDARSGCSWWEYRARGPVRTAIAAARSASGWVLLFGDQRGHAYALDALTGRERWVARVDEHRAALVTGALVVDGERVYVPVASAEEAVAMNPNVPCCTFRGSVVALDLASGRPLWKGWTITTEPAPTRKNEKDVQSFGPSGAAVWSSPTVDRHAGMVYATTGNSYSDPPADGSNAIVAFRAASGERAWVRQTTSGDAYTMACNRGAPGAGNCPQSGGPDHDFGASAMLVDLGSGRRALIAGQKSGMVHAVDPDREGAILWQTRVGAGGRLGGVQWGTAADDRHVYAAVSDLQFQAVAPGTPGGQPTPFGATLRVGGEGGGGLVAIDPASGRVVWRTPHPGCAGVAGCSPAQSAAVSAIPGVVFSGGVDGVMRAYDAATGRIVWSVDTRRPYATVNGVPAQGGSIDGPGVVVVDGMVYVSSGYAIFGGAPGNVLLAFAVE